MNLPSQLPFGSRVYKGVALCRIFIGAKAFIKFPAMYIIRDVCGMVVNRSSDSEGGDDKKPGMLDGLRTSCNVSYSNCVKQ
jgi:hypothetical protein